MVNIALAHAARDRYAEPSKFDPARFLERPPDNYSWIPFGGGIRRCIGAAFANMEMDVTARILLREFAIEPTAMPAEPFHSRAWRMLPEGVAASSSIGGRRPSAPRGPIPPSRTAVRPQTRTPCRIRPGCRRLRVATRL